ncbi:MAG: hypothetical protein OEW75_15720, partial [Cyclobacteriaceae bacterium]|nr:hypothetical protein [Cyclobacteriaceae bacterium]
MKKIYVIFMAMVSFFTGYGQIDARLMQYPDVSDSHIAFTYGDDIYIVDKAGGVAHQLTSPQGPEFYPRFSPDGKYIAYTANYNGNFDVYVIPAMGGVPKRLTYHGMPDMVQGWTPDGKSVLFTSLRESGKERFSKFFTVSAEGGTPTRLPIPYGEFASYSSDGNTIAYTDRSRVNRNWKRYRGGTAPDIMIFDLTTFKTENITNNAANDETPMWVGNSIYYMSDNGPEKRNNIWKYDVEKTTNTQITQFKDFDITFPANGKDEIVFEAGGNIYLLNLNNGISEEVNIQVINDQRALIPTLKNVAENLQSATISPDGKRVVVQARGELFDLPATEGFVSNISQNSGTAERYPAWSPDGKSLAYWSDASGEYQLMIRNMTKDTQPIAITNFTSGFNYEIFWSPNSKKIVSINQAMEVQLIDVATGSVKITDHGKYMFEGNLRGFKVSWSPDSRYFIYSMSKENRVTSSLFLYDTQNNQLNKLTSGFYNDADPVFSSDGNYIFYTT